MDSLFYLALILILGVLGGRIVKFLKLPNVTGYILIGLLIGPHLLNIIPSNKLTSFAVFSDVALGFIAFTIGSEFKWSYLKQVGIAPIVIAIFEALGAVLLVTGGLLLIPGMDVRFAIVLGSIAAATAPAATVMIIKQYNAKGKLTQTLMSVVAIDDAIAIIGFGIAVAIANVLAVSDSSVLVNLLKPVYEIFSSLALGALIAIVFNFILKFFQKTSNRSILIVGFIFLCVGLSKFINASPLLSCMAMGALFVNINKSSYEIQNILDIITPPIFVIFFVESGAELNISLIPSIGLIGIVYVILRVLGKIGGAYAGCKLMKSPKEVTNYLGWTLIPQAGVAIGLSLVAQSVLPLELSSDIRTIVLCATLIYEIIGPIISKMALVKAGDIILPPKIAKAKKVKEL